MTAGRKLRLLIVEDEAIVSMLLEDCLEELGHAVVGSADSTVAAIALATDLTPDLVLCDIKLMHGDSGIDVATALEPLGIACLFISGNCPAPDVGRGIAIGCLRKPFHPGRIEDAIRAVLAICSGHAPAVVPTGMMVY